MAMDLHGHQPAPQPVWGSGRVPTALELPEHIVPEGPGAGDGLRSSQPGWQRGSCQISRWEVALAEDSRLLAAQQARRSLFQPRACCSNGQEGMDEGMEQRGALPGGPGQSKRRQGWREAAGNSPRGAPKAGEQHPPPELRRGRRPGLSVNGCPGPVLASGAGPRWAPLGFEAAWCAWDPEVVYFPWGRLCSGELVCAGHRWDAPGAKAGAGDLVPSLRPQPWDSPSCPDLLVAAPSPKPMGTFLCCGSCHKAGRQWR